MTTRNLKMNLSGRIKKVKTSNTLVPLFETISNSIHSIEDRGKQNGTITVEIIRNPRQSELLMLDEKPITGFVITDDGVGFNDKNMESFEESDSTFKASRGGKGIGRISWLKFFEKASISSSYKEGESLKRREFSFSTNGIDEKQTIDLIERSKIETQVKLDPLFMNFEGKTRKGIDEITIALVEHFISYLVTDSMPKTTIIDGAAKKYLREFYSESLGKSATVDNFNIGQKSFKLTGIRNYLGGSKHAVYFCGDKRVADRVYMWHIDPFFKKRFVDADLKKYSYQAFIESEYLDQIVNDDRDGFRFPENMSLESLLEDAGTKDEIFLKAFDLVKKNLELEIGERKKENISVIENFVSVSACPRRISSQTEQGV